MIFRVVYDEILMTISPCENSKDAWALLRQMYLGSDKIKKFTLFSKIFNMTQLENESVVFLASMKDMRNQLIACNCDWLNENLMCFIIMRNLLEKFTNFMDILNTRVNQGETITLESLS